MTPTSRPRWWPLILIGLLVLIGWIRQWAGEASDRQSQVLGTLGIGLLGAFLGVLWLLFLSRLPWRRRLAGVGVMALALALAAVLVEIRGVTGDFVPILAWRFAPEGDADVRAAADAFPLVPTENDWAGLYGSDRRAEVDGPALADWTQSPPREIWRREVGPSWSSVAIVGDSLFTLEQHGPEEVLARYRLADGEPVWARGWSARYDTTIAGIGPRTTPTVDRGTVFAFGGTGTLAAVDAASGALLWTRDVLQDTGGVLGDWGKAASPLIVDGLVVVSGGAESAEKPDRVPNGPTELVAYDRDAGTLVWRAGGTRPSYSSPQLALLDGEQQILSFNAASVSAHRPRDGETLWTVEWPAGQPNVAVPLVLPGDRVLVSSGYGIGSLLFRVGRHDDGAWSTEELWRGPALKSKFANVLFHEGTIYGLDDGRFVAVDPETGKRRWKRGRYGHGQPILVGDRIVVQTEPGPLVLLAAEPGGHAELGTVPAFDSKTWNPPAIAGRVLVVRNDREMAAYELETR